MEIVTSHIIEWLILGTLIGLAIYTLKIIGQEKSSFRQECYEVRFGDLSLMIPKWWGLTEQNSVRLKFERTVPMFTAVSPPLESGFAHEKRVSVL